MVKYIFVINSLRCGGAERVVSILANQFAEKEKVGILTYGDTEIFYETRKNIDFYCIIGGKVVPYQPKKMAHYNNVKTETKANATLEKKSGIAVKIIKVIIGRRFYSLLCKIISKQKDKYNFWITYLQKRRAIRAFGKEYPDTVFIAFMTDANVLTLDALRVCRNPVFVSERNDPNAGYEWYRKKRNKLYPNATGLVFQTEEAKMYFNNIISYKSEVIPNPIVSGLPLRYMGERKKEIVNFCRLSSGKNLPLLISSFSDFLMEYPDYILKIYGDGNLKEELEYQIEEMGLSNKVILYGKQSEIHTKVIDAAMFVSTSNYEGISNSMIEALAIGLPTVCTDCPIGGARLMINSGNNGILVPVGDKDSVCAAMKMIAGDREFAKRLSINAVESCRKYTESAIAERWSSFIYRMVQTGRNQ